MSNQKSLEKYLIGEDGYLKSDISNGKVIMLSGKWGSGKTHFWQNKIQTVLNDKYKKIPNHYISLYGKTSIQEIKNEIFLKIFESVDSYKVIEKGKNLAKNSVNLASSFFGAISILGVSLDISKISDKPFENLEKILDDKKLKRTEEHLNSGAIICFDDFERKSKEIDLNDLFGFITQLTLNFDCKVVIILNDDVFEGEEKKIFSNVKEKSVAKFLKYEPSIKELFNLIFYKRKKDDKKKFEYLKLRKYKQIILKTIEETQELNARIYIQVLDNLVEWIEKTRIDHDNYLKCFIFTNINFVLNHHIFEASYEVNNPISGYDMFNHVKGEKNLKTEKTKLISFLVKSKITIPQELDLNKYNLNQIEQMSIDYGDNNRLKEFIERHESLIKSELFIGLVNKENCIKSNNEAEAINFNRISKFIETGILIHE